jgi:sorbose PTS system EIIB component
MKIKLVRIDDRLIHGQVVTVWSKEAKAERIIICSDTVAKDKIRRQLLRQVAPPGIKVNIVGIDKAIRVYKNPKYLNDNVFYLFTCPKDVLRMVKGGVDIKSVNIGGMAFKTGKKQITKAISVDDEDIAAFKELNSLGIELEIRAVPEDSKVNIMDKI